jgi:predicted enzyme related to lactoylglutathione lyase
MKYLGIEHVIILVNDKDMDKTTGFFKKLFDIDFAEAPNGAELQGIRFLISQPDHQIEVVSVVDPVKAAKVPRPTGFIAEAAARGEKGLISMYLRVEDADKAAEVARSKGIGVVGVWDEKTLIPEEQRTASLPHIKEVVFDVNDMPFKYVNLIET